MLPEACIKREEHVQLSSLITTRDQVKLLVSLLGKVHGMFVRHGMKIRREVPTSRAGFTREVAGHDWSPLERVELYSDDRRPDAEPAPQHQTTGTRDRGLCQSVAGL